jgi:hypothetical protein
MVLAYQCCEQSYKAEEDDAFYTPRGYTYTGSLYANHYSCKLAGSVAKIVSGRKHLVFCSLRYSQRI